MDEKSPRRMGAPPDNRNALKNGHYTNAEKARGRELVALRRRVRDLKRRVRMVLIYVDGGR